MSDAMKRTLRTVMQLVVTAVTAVPVIVLALPENTQAAPVVAGVLAWAAVVTRVMTALEDAGLIPAWLRDTDA